MSRVLSVNTDTPKCGGKCPEVGVYLGSAGKPIGTGGLGERWKGLVSCVTTRSLAFPVELGTTEDSEHRAQHLMSSQQDLFGLSE